MNGTPGTTITSLKSERLVITRKLDKYLKLMVQRVGLEELQWKLQALQDEIYHPQTYIIEVTRQKQEEVKQLETNGDYLKNVTSAERKH